MPRLLLISLSTLFLSSQAIAQQTEASSDAVVDFVTPLDELIQKFNTDWEYKLTGKAYWIGYTDNMYSIAARGEAAIPALVSFIKNSDSDWAQLGALHSLHLIGIESKVRGRFYEKFVSKAAREALLELLHLPEIRRDVVELLIRDPWLSDVPKLFEFIEICKSDCWYMVNMLLRYEIEKFPLQQIIPEHIGKAVVPIQRIGKYKKGGVFDYEAQFHGILKSIEESSNKNIRIEEALYQTELWGFSQWQIGGKYIRSAKKNTIRIDFFLRNIARVDFTFVGNKIQYFMKDDQLHICSPTTAKQMVLDFWNNLTAVQKKAFDKDISKISARVEDH